MAYEDPSQIRSIVIQFRVNEAEADLLRAVIRFTGGQKSTTVREMTLARAQAILSGMADLGGSSESMEAANNMQFAAQR